MNAAAFAITAAFAVPTAFPATYAFATHTAFAATAALARTTAFAAKGNATPVGDTSPLVSEITDGFTYYS